MKKLIIAMLLLLISTVSFAQRHGYGHRGHYVRHGYYHHYYGHPYYRHRYYHRYYGHPRYYHRRRGAHVVIRL